jgi:hypothetical protein
MRLNWKLVSVCLKIVLIVTLHRCTACGESTVVSKIILDAPESCFGRFGDGVVSVQDRCSVCAKRTIVGLENHFGCTRALVTRLNWKLILFHLEIMLILT